MATDWANFGARPKCHCATEDMQEVDTRALVISKTVNDAISALGPAYSLCADTAGYVVLTVIASMLRAYAMKDFAEEYVDSDMDYEQRIEVCRRSQVPFETMVAGLAKQLLNRDAEIIAMVERDGGSLS